MALITDSLLLDVMLVLPIILIGLYHYLTSSFNYWRDRNVPYIKPYPIIGNLYMKKSYSEFINKVYSKFENERFCGTFQFSNPTLMIRDPKLIGDILIKDFSHFEDRGLPLDEQNEPLSINLVNLTGNKWRMLRHKLTPTHTSGKLKKMFDQIYNCGGEMLKVIQKCVETGEEIDAKILTSTFSKDVIASCAFGLQFKSDTPEGKRFAEMVDKSLGTTKTATWRMTINMFFPKIARLLGFKKIPQDVNNYFIELTKATMYHRQQNNIKRDDFLQLLMNLKQHEDPGNQTEPNTGGIDHEDIHLQYLDDSKPKDNSLKFTDEILSAQAFVFLTAGSDSTATAISVVLHHLAIHQEIQRRLQEEVDTVLTRYGNSWTYETLKDMTYMDQIIQESMRMFPVGLVVLRKCTSPYQVPDSDLTIEPGMSVIIPTVSLHHDPAYYPDPQTFDPNRFEGNNFKPSPVFLPFGIGPRMCIAMRFALLEVKVFLARLVSRYSVMPSSKTITPLQYDPTSFSIRVHGGVWVSFRQREI